MHELVERFHTACNARFTVGRRRNAYPADIKEVGVSYAVAAALEGRSEKQIAAELGITGATLRTWLQPSAPAPRAKTAVAMAPVRIEAAPRPAIPPYVVHACGTLRIECQDAAAVAALVRALQCSG